MFWWHFWPCWPGLSQNPFLPWLSWPQMLLISQLLSWFFFSGTFTSKSYSTYSLNVFFFFCSVFWGLALGHWPSLLFTQLTFLGWFHPLLCPYSAPIYADNSQICISSLDFFLEADHILTTCLISPLICPPGTSKPTVKTWTLHLSPTYCFPLSTLNRAKSNFI